MKKLSKNTAVSTAPAFDGSILFVVMARGKFAPFAELGLDGRLHIYPVPKEVSKASGLDVDLQGHVKVTKS